MTNYTDISDLREAVDTGQPLVVSLLQLREMEGYNRLGPRVLEDIATKLSGQGIGYFPTWVIEDNPTPRANEEVRLFLKDSNLGRIVLAVLEPSTGGDERLIQVSEDDAAQTLEKIRTLIEQ